MEKERNGGGSGGGDGEATLRSHDLGKPVAGTEHYRQGKSFLFFIFFKARQILNG